MGGGLQASPSHYSEGIHECMLVGGGGGAIEVLVRNVIHYVPVLLPNHPIGT